jgi:hypothetical protein
LDRTKPAGQSPTGRHSLYPDEAYLKHQQEYLAQQAEKAVTADATLDEEAAIFWNTRIRRMVKKPTGAFPVCPSPTCRGHQTQPV